MPIDKLNVVYSVDDKMEYPIIKLSLARNTKDLYLFDKSNNNFHISIHKSGYVYLTFQNDWEEKENVRIFKFNWDLLDEDIEKEKPILLYIPSSVAQYPEIYKQTSQTATVYIADNPETLLFKFFIINEDAKKPKGRESDMGVLVTRMVKYQKNGKIIDEQVEEHNPSLRFINHRIRFTMDRSTRPDACNKYKMLFLFQPNHEISMTEFINQTVFEIDFEEINKIGYTINRYLVKNECAIALLVY